MFKSFQRGVKLYMQQLRSCPSNYFKQRYFLFGSMSTLYCCNNEMKANRVLYKLKSINTNANEENNQVPFMKLFAAIL